MKDFPEREYGNATDLSVEKLHDRIDALEPLFDALNEKGRMLSDYINAMGVSPLAKEAWKGRVVDLERQVKALDDMCPSLDIGQRLEALESHLFGGSQAAPPEPRYEWRCREDKEWVYLSHTEPKDHWRYRQRRRVGDWEPV